MIGQLTGTIVKKNPPCLVVNVQGVGYELEASMTTFYDLGSIGDEILIYTHLAIRDDTYLLFGFASEHERLLFRNLIKVNGVGAKLALTILSGMSGDEFIHCVQQSDLARLVRLPGVGKKTAERLIIEMRDKLKDTKTEHRATGTTHPSMAPHTHHINDANSALIALGYKPQEAHRLISLVVHHDTMSSDEIIREALKAAVKK